MQTFELTDDSKAILLLCARFSSRSDPDDIKAFSITEYNTIAAWLVNQNMRPGNLLTEEGQSALANERTTNIDIN